MTLTDTLLGAVAAAAASLPASAPLVPGPAQSAVSADLLPVGAELAVVAKLSGAVTGEIVCVVDPALVAALRTSPLGSLALAPAVQPALDAAAAALGQVRADGGVELDPTTALGQLATRPNVVVVPLLAEGIVQATIALSLNAAASVPSQRGLPRVGGLELLRDVEMEVTAELGRTRMAVRELLSLAPGAVVELDRAAGSPADLLVNGTLIARGEVVVVDEDFGIRITEIVAGAERQGESGAA